MSRDRDVVAELLDRFENAVRREAEIENLHHEAIADLAEARSVIHDWLATYRREIALPAGHEGPHG